MPDDTLFLRPGGVVVELRGLDLLGGPARRWVDAALQPLASPRPEPPDVVIQVAVRPRPPHRAEYGLWLGTEGIWSHDGRGRGVVLDLGAAPLAAWVPPAVTPARLNHGVYLLLVATALWKGGATLLRAAVVELGDRRLAITGWSSSGKTGVVLELLSRGGRLVGDDVVSLRHGQVGPVLAEVTVRPGHVVGGDRSPARVPRTRGAGSGGWAARLGSHPWFAQLTTRVGDLRRSTGERRLPPVPPERMGAEGRLDALLFLGVAGSTDDAMTLAALSASYQVPHAATAAAALQLWGDRYPHGVFPDPDDRIAAARDALGGLPIAHSAAVQDPRSAAEAADRLMALGGLA